jgi:hypothetical protein
MSTQKLKNYSYIFIHFQNGELDKIEDIKFNVKVIRKEK